MSDAPVTRGFTRYRVLLGAIIVQLILGTVYGYSIFWQPLTSEVFPTVITEAEADVMRLAGQEVIDYVVVADAQAAVTERAVQRGYLKYAFSICILSFAVTMVIAGRIQDIAGPRFTAIIGAVLMGLGFIVAGMMDNPLVFLMAHAGFVGLVAILMLMIFHALLSNLSEQNVPLLKYVPMGVVTAAVVAGVLLGQQYVGRLGEFDKLFVLWGTVGFMAGAGIGFAYVCPIAAVVKWFPNQKGLVSGLAVAGFGFGAYIFSHPRLPVSAEYFIKNHDITELFMVHGLVCIFGVIVGAMMLTNPPGTAARPGARGGDSTWQDTLKRPAFYVVWLMFFSGAMAGLMVIGILKDFAGDQLVNAATASGPIQPALRLELLGKGAAAVGWLAIFNAVGRVAWGFVSDRLGRTPALMAMFSLQAAMMFVLVGMETEMSLAIAASIVGFNFGGNFALFPSVTADLFGARNLGANYGWVFTSYGIAGVAGMAAGTAAKTMTDSYAVAFQAAAVLCIISAILAAILGAQQRRARAA